MLQLACWSAETGQAAKGDIIGALLLWGASLVWLGADAAWFRDGPMLLHMHAGCCGVHRARSALLSLPHRLRSCHRIWFRTKSCTSRMQLEHQSCSPNAQPAWCMLGI